MLVQPTCRLAHDLMPHHLCRSVGNLGTNIILRIGIFEKSAVSIKIPASEMPVDGYVPDMRRRDLIAARNGAATQNFGEISQSLNLGLLEAQLCLRTESCERCWSPSR